MKAVSKRFLRRQPSPNGDQWPKAIRKGSERLAARIDEVLANNSKGGRAAQ